MKIISWNVNGIRAWYKKGAFEWVVSQKPDFFCVQETKAHIEQLNPDILSINNEFPYSNFNSSIEKKGYSGTAIFSKIKPDNVTFGLGIKELDGQGRQINLFFGKRVLINCYFPNGGGEHSKFLYKLRYFKEFIKFINSLKQKGYSIIFCGDINIAHQEIDLARPKSNEKEVGFLPEERVIIDEIIKLGYQDVFRKIHPKKIKYSWWDMKTFSRDRNVGWRLDYFFVDNNIFKKVLNIEIHDEIFGSDHCPVSLIIKD
jgi:exodeoxyribonuclease-3